MEMVSRSTPAAPLAALALAAALALTAPVARAGSYHVYGCRTPAGQPAPTDGWSGAVAPRGTFDQYVKDTCAEGGALIAALGDATPHATAADKAAWTFTPPPGASMTAATLYRAGDAAGGGNTLFSYGTSLAGPAETSVFDSCAPALGCATRGNLSQPLAGENRLAVPVANIGAHLYAIASCLAVSGECPAGSGDASGYAAAVYVFASDITLEQLAGPTAGDVAGELASAPSVQGTSNLTFTASDPGAGVYEARVYVDGRLVQAPPLDDNGGRCRDVGQTSDGRPAFLYVQPCAASLSAELALDTTGLTDGPHHLLVSVLDAAGNSAPVLDREISVANPAPPGCAAGQPTAASSASATAAATLAASWNANGRDRLTARFGRAETIVGRLTGPGGAPIGGATLELLATPAYEGAAPQQMSGPQTGPDGRFALRLARGVSSRSLCLAYRPAGGASPVTRTLALSVRAGITLGVSPHVTSVGREIVFRGRLRSGPIPPAGKQLVLEARSARAPWLVFEVVRTSPRGRFHARYRFRFPGPANYQFRVLSEPESDYPFTAGYSNAVTVRER